MCQLASRMWRRARNAFPLKVDNLQIFGRRKCYSTAGLRYHEDARYRAGLVTALGRHYNSLDALINEIDAAPTHWPTPTGKSCILVILLTSKLAQHAIDPSLGTKLLEKLCLNGFTETADVFTAIVDKLPSPEGKPEGCDGLSYLVTNAPLYLEAKSLVQLNPSAQKPGFLTFKGIASPLKLSESSSAQLPVDRQGASQVQVPLAQTVFSTGWPSTLIHTVYKYRHGRPLRVDETYLESASIPLPNLCNVIDLDVPLVPLTPARQVTKSMGNIVKELSISSVATRLSQQNGLTVDAHPSPASQELEKAVSEFFASRQLPPEPVQVWSMIIPAQLSSHALQRHLPVKYLTGYDQSSGHIRDLWPQITSNDEQTSLPVSMRLEPKMKILTSEMVFGLKARLAKVLSGGGGWGEKAGLLSLDPDTEYSTRVIREDQGWDLELDADDNVSSSERRPVEMWDSIIAKNDLVMFFMPLNNNEIGKSIFERSPVPASAIVFGVLPSSIDEMPDVEPGSNEASSTDVQSKYHEGLFGILSEEGVFVRMAGSSNTNDAIWESKINIPFASIRITAANASSTDSLAAMYERPDQLAEKLAGDMSASLNSKLSGSSNAQEFRSVELDNVFEDRLAQALQSVFEAQDLKDADVKLEERLAQALKEVLEFHDEDVSAKVL